MFKFPNELEYNKGIEQLVGDINAYYQDVQAPRIPVWPERFTYHQMREYPVREEAPFYLGLEKEHVDLVGVERYMTPFTILGEGAKGKTNTLKIILEQLAGQCEIYLFDMDGMGLYGFKDRPGLHYIENEEDLENFVTAFEQEVETRKEVIRQHLERDPAMNPKDLAMEQSPLYLIVDEWDYFVEFISKKKAQLYPLISASASVGVSVILTANSARIKLFDEITKYAKNTTDGLLVGSVGTTGIFPVATAKDMPQFKEGLLFHNGTYHRLRLPKFD
jgi:S-DNA-T family DNA segregation ATPase FtsK/SpoIIIE